VTGVEIGKQVKVINPNQINYPLTGVVIESDDDWEQPMSKVKFGVSHVWYANEDLKEVE
jgi:hypothetical protein